MPEYAEWHLIQFTQDVRRREPRNVGLAVTDGKAWRVRMFATSPAGSVNGRALRTLRLSKDDYAQWVSYYFELLGAGNIEQVRRSQQRRPTEFRVIPGGHAELRDNLSSFTDTLFRELVHDEQTVAPESPSRALEAKVEDVLRIAQIDPVPAPLVPAVWDGDIKDDVHFDYMFTNGKVHLMDRLQLSQTSTEQAKILARDFNARAHAVEKAGYANSFIAFYSQDVVDAIGDSVLAPLWRVGEIIDVDDLENAAGGLRHYIYG
ncbi:hypothetical protein SEA_MARTEENA_39 [Gordonia phage Marteena]|nr:hypothetical protein SEA_EMSQUAREDA_40 [Gordonia phage EMsquaredA]QDP45124.1 hypothetical protein SEA_MARTEENA_39 [Gordonia phage Marteena]